MAAGGAVVFSHSHRSAVVRPRSPDVVPLPCSSSRPRVVNPACVVSPVEDAADKAARQRRYRPRHGEPPRSSPVRRRRRRDDDRDASPDRKRRRESVSRGDARRGGSSTSGGSSSRIRPSAAAGGADAHRCDHREVAYRAAKKQECERERVQEATRRSGSASSRSEQRAQHQTTITARSRAVVDRSPPVEIVDDAEARRRQEIQRQRVKARLELDKMVRTVEFNNPFISPLDVLKPRCPGG